MDAPRLSPIQDDYQTERGFQRQSDSLARLLQQLTDLVRRQYLLIVVIIAFTMALGVVYLMITPPIYTAHAKLIMDSGKVRALQQQIVPGYYMPDNTAEAMTQLEILKSDSIGSTIVKNQKLTENPAFVGGTGEGPLRKV